MSSDAENPTIRQNKPRISLTGVGQVVNILVLAVLGLTLYHTNKSNQHTQALLKLQIQQQIREMFLEQQELWFDLDAHNYPENGRHYSEVDRERIRRYYKTVVFHEWIMCNHFQKGILGGEWDQYVVLIRGSINDYPILQEEYAYFRQEPLSYGNEVTQLFIEEMDRMAGNLKFRETHRKSSAGYSSRNRIYGINWC